MSRPTRGAETAREGCARKLRGEVVASVVDEPSVDSGRRARRIAAVEVLAEHTYGVPRLLEVLGKVPAPAQTGTLMQRATCSIRHATCTTQHALLHRTCRAVRRHSALSDGTALATCECSGQTDRGRPHQWFDPRADRSGPISPTLPIVRLRCNAAPARRAPLCVERRRE